VTLMRQCDTDRSNSGHHIHVPSCCRRTYSVCGALSPGCCCLPLSRNNNRSKQADIRLHRRHRRTVQSYSQCALPRRHVGATWRIRLNLGFVRPTRVHNPLGKSIGAAVFAGLTSVTDRPTDHATQSITIDCMRSTAMRPNNNININ